MHLSQQALRPAPGRADSRVLLLTPRYFSLMTRWGLRLWPPTPANEVSSSLDRRAECAHATGSGHPRAFHSVVSLVTFAIVHCFLQDLL
jgi:hypothetical protein